MVRVISCFLLLFSSLFLYAQSGQKIEIINSDIIESDENIAGGADRLKGHVEIQINNAVLKCDSAYYHSSGEASVEAFSKVKVTQGDSLHLFGDYMKFTQKDSLLIARDNVRLEQEGAILYTEILDYMVQSKTGYYYGGGKLIQEKDTLTSLKGIFNAQHHMATFYKDVVYVSEESIIYSDSLAHHIKTKNTFFYKSTEIINKDQLILCERGKYDPNKKIFEIDEDGEIRDPNQIISGDTIRYFVDEETGWVRSNVQIYDSVNEIKLYGGYAYYDKKVKNLFITDKAYMVQLMDEDSIFIHGDTLKMVEDDSTGKQYFLCYRDVKIFKSNLQGVCDSLAYKKEDSVIQMYYDPVLWSEENQLLADDISIYMKDQKMDYMILDKNAFIIDQQGPKMYNQIKGKNMIGYFKKNELYKVFVSGNGETVFYPRDDNDGFIGVNIASCSKLLILIRKRKPFKVRYMTKPDAIMYPLNGIDDKKTKLKGFKWLDTMRPKDRFSILD